MNPIDPHCCYCVNGDIPKEGAGVHCRIKDDKVQERDNTCSEWKISSLSTLKIELVGVVPCIRCKDFRFIHEGGYGWCAMPNSNKRSLTILNSCKYSRDQGYNYGMTKSSFKLALDVALAPVEERIQQLNNIPEMPEEVLKGNLDDRIRYIIGNKASYLRAFKAAFYSIRSRADYLPCTRKETYLIKHTMKRAGAYPLPRPERSANHVKEGMYIAGLQFNAFLLVLG